MAIQTYLVGGYVRDLLLSRHGIPATPSDKDYVVVGATPEYMVSKGFIPVGADFPVFLHPKTHEEYALARTERKTAPGYHGFTFSASPDVTLEEDLMRRDLTINAIAMSEDGTLFDPWGGEEDIRKRVFRHVSPAFREDPVRILRIARFSARLPEFSVDPGTWQLITDMVKAGEAVALVPERVMKELSRGLMEKAPSRMMRILLECGAWTRIAPDVPCSEALLRKLDEASGINAPAAVRLALLFSEAGDRGSEAAKSLRAGSDAIGLVELGERCSAMLREKVEAESAVRLFEKADAFRRYPRFREFLQVQQIASGVRPESWLRAADAARAVATRDIAAAASSPSEIPAAIRAARVKAVRDTLAQTHTDKDNAS